MSSLGRTGRLRLLRLWGGFIALVALVTWLFLRAGEVSTEAHYAYLNALRRLQHADVELNAAVLGSYADLVHNYDAIVRHLDEIEHERRTIERIPAWLPEEYRLGMSRKLGALLVGQQAKSDDVDRFRRSNAVLRNSLNYFPEAADAYLSDPKARVSDEVRRFVREVLAFGQGPAQRTTQDLQARLSAFMAETGPASVERTTMLTHARVILSQRPEVDAVVHQITHAPTAVLHEALISLYSEGYAASVARTAIYRQLLYVVSIALLLYVIYAVFRIDRDRRQLAQRRAEAQLRLYAKVFTSANEGMMITDAQSRILAVNPAFTEITGYVAAEVVDQWPSMLKSGRQSEDFYRQMWAELAASGQWNGEVWNRRKDGVLYPEWLSIAAVRDEQGEATHYIGVFTDISERKQSEERIRHLAHHDALTGLPNRILLEDRIKQAILKSRRSELPTAVIFIDLDRFKNINDTLGHEVGDNLLMQAAERGLASLRETDTLCRLGGDEFVVVLPELEHVQDAMHVARKLLAEFSRPYLLAGHALTVTASAGVAVCPDDAQSVSDLLRLADAAMYRAKEEGRNTVCFHSAGVDEASLGELLLENDLRMAVARNELAMYFQPKVDAASGRLVGAEALMRWAHPKHGMISPARFIALAENSGLIAMLGEWAIETVCAQQRAWLDAGLAIVPVAVNVSAQQFSQQDVPRMVAGKLARHGLRTGDLSLELTESLLMRNTARAAGILRALHEMNIEIAIDDFGTGYSSLSYLNQFPVQLLKIDRSFVSEIDARGNHPKLASAIIAMAHELGLKVIAEGVETDAQRDFLLAHGCDQFQGFMYGRPEPAAQMENWLREAAS